MTTWNRTLDAAGITAPGLREDYAQARSTVAGFKRDAYLAVRLLVAPELVPHVLAATAFMHRTDDLLDSGSPDRRPEAYAGWEREVRAALDGDGTAGLPLVRALRHSCAAHPVLRPHITAFLDTARTDLEFTGFRSEADYQHYIDAYSLPALMVVACLLAPVDPDGRVDAGFRAACRTYIDGSQRLDFVNDLAEDLAADRLTVPEDALKRYGVTREDLAAGRATAEVRALLGQLLGQARASLEAGRGLAGLTAPVNRPLVRALVGLDLLTAREAADAGDALLRGPLRPSVPAALGLLLREHRAARRARRRPGD
ncbi:squalene/phytoene synthase family protein [Streptacidiphilus sp. PB12-B1b]|uniref:phytoene/squalene synthase family protein n=1 Tax=Streptacidiphilus sp. PB12-B1b TaxID=2705012 RepID=UPI001CDC7D36|nr:squalene/phytoene synthase family protein [Streptacidiphilus sp. PB12-B1b]QMU77830.1 squalene/phytoene synthase family protein [Streptacidiphilus sp. PB12-B1b]